MKKRYSQETLSIFLGCIGVILGIAGLIPIIIDGKTNILFWILITIACGFFIYGLIVYANDQAYDFLSKILGGPVSSITPCEDKYIEYVHKLAVSYFGGQVTSPQKIREILSKYRPGLQIALGTEDVPPNVRGYYFLFPINKTCVTKIKDFNFNVSQIDSGDITAKPRYAEAIYIGGIVGNDFWSRVEILGAVKSHANIVHQTRSKTAYARAATKDGLRVLVRNGFTPVHPRATDIDCFYMKSFKTT